jgi:hypothetical protein
VAIEPKNNESKNNFSRKNHSEFSDNVCDFYFIVDKNGMFEDIGAPVKKNSAFFQQASIGGNYFACLPAETRAKARKIFNFFSINGEPYRVTSEIGVGANSQSNCEKIYFTPNFNEMGKLIGYRASGWLEPKKPEQVVER